MDNISIKEKNNIKIYDNSVIYLLNKFTDFQINKLILEISKIVDFEIKYAISFDKINWSLPVKKEDFDVSVFNINDYNEYYVSIWCSKINLEKNTSNTLYIQKNIENINVNILEIDTIKYNDLNIKFTENNISITTLTKIINTNNKWNFYDNQQTNIRRWLDNCISVVNSYGHQCIYFKTEVEEVNNTLSTNVRKNVTNIKKIPIISVDNELPQDRNIYTEWDMPMEGEFVIHIIDELFKQAFGETKVPLSKDYLYLPIVNKLFRISSVQPVNGFMGKIGWWEVFLSKYEDDETIKISDSLKEVYNGIQEFDDSFKIIDELNDLLDEDLIDEDYIDEITVDEKNEVTGNMSNRLVDSTHYIDLKESDLQRQFFSRKLAIVSINPDNNAFPITMYNCSNVDKRIVALTYNLTDLTNKNKKSLIVDTFEFSTNFVLLSKFSGELFDFIGIQELSVFTLEFNRKKLSLILSKYQKTFVIDYDFIENEFYQILIKYNDSLKQLSINIYMLKDKQKNIVYQNLYIIKTDLYNKFEFSKLYLYGGKFLINELVLKINNEKILTDNIAPILVMNKMGLL